jgi:hypothetical protein
MFDPGAAMYPWNNLTTLLLAAGTIVLRSALDRLSDEAIPELVKSRGPKEACDLLLGVYHALEDLYSKSVAFRDALSQWPQFVQKMAELQLKYVPRAAQDQLLEGINGVDRALSGLADHAERARVLRVLYPSASGYARERLEGQLMETLEPQQYQADSANALNARSLFIARVKHLLALEDTNIQRIQELGDQLGDILRSDFNL